MINRHYIKETVSRYLNFDSFSLSAYIKLLIGIIFVILSLAVNARTFNGIELPESLGQFHYTKYHDYENTNKGLGYGAEYSSRGVKATIFIYNLGKKVSSDIDSHTVKDAFNDSVKEIYIVYPKVEVIEQPIKIILQGRGFIKAKYRLTKNNENLVSTIFFTVSKGNFVKVRFTYVSGEYRAQGESMQNEFIEQLTKSLT